MVPGHALINNQKTIYGLIVLENIYFFFLIFFLKRKGTENETIKKFEFWPPPNLVCIIESHLDISNLNKKKKKKNFLSKIIKKWNR